LLIVLFGLSACRAQATQVQPTPAITNLVEPVFTREANRLPATDVEVPRVSIEEAKAALEAGTAAIVDVRSPPAFAARHIAGAINVPLGDIELDPASVPLKKDQWIITYCA
jgi:3-mercaptopyruvate sulfurtransferase SseA